MQWVGAGRSDLGHIETKLGIEASCGKIAGTCAKGGDKKAIVARV
jgi:hypothetical protein